LANTTFTSKLSDGKLKRLAPDLHKLQHQPADPGGLDHGESGCKDRVGLGDVCTHLHALYVGASRVRDNGQRQLVRQFLVQRFGVGSKGARLCSAARAQRCETAPPRKRHPIATAATRDRRTLTLTDGGGAIDTGTYNATINSAIAGGGRMRKSGAGQ